MTNAQAIRVTDNLFYGSGLLCRPAHETELAIVHACKTPCHQSAVGYTKSLPNTHPHYLAHEKPHHLYLNLVDPPVPLFMLESFGHFFDFVDREIQQRPVLIHCNQGESRAPSLALLYMAKRLNLLPNDNYAAAREAFQASFPYNPGQGIQTFLSRNWNALG